MKSKLSTYLLIVAVAGIWGTISYKIINGINADPPEVAAATPISEFNPKPIEKKETFSISEVDRDPFLGTLQKKNKPKEKRTRRPTVSKPVNAPKIDFAGIVKNGNNQVFVIAINGRQHLMRKGQTVNDVKLLSGDSKQIVVRFNNTNSVILAD